jgi:hypothetical protein
VEVDQPLAPVVCASCALWSYGRGLSDFMIADGGRDVYVIASYHHEPPPGAESLLVYDAYRNRPLRTLRLLCLGLPPEYHVVSVSKIRIVRDGEL